MNVRSAERSIESEGLASSGATPGEDLGFALLEALN
jgi:hypothetical protein